MKHIFVYFIFFSIFIKGVNAQNLVFAKSAGSNTPDSSLDQGNDIITDNLGNIYVTGTMSSWGGGSVFGQGEINQTTLSVNGSFIAKYAPNGLLLWAKQIDANNNMVVSNAITLDDQNNIYITGYFGVQVTFGAGTLTATTLYSNSNSRDAFFAKYSQDGNFIWAKSFGGMNDETGGRDIKLDSSNNIYVSGAISGLVVFGAGEPNETTLIANYDMFISKYTEKGELIWVRKAGSSRHTSAKNMDLDANGNIYITGNFFYDITFAESEPNEIKLNRNNEQAYIAKYDSNGQFIWAKSPYFYSDDGTNISGDIKVINDNRIVYTGAYGSYRYTYLTSCVKLSGIGYYDTILIQFDSNGDYIWNATINSTGDDRGLALDVDQNGNSFVAGYFSNNTIVNEGLCENTQLNNNGKADVFIGVYDINGQLLSIETAGGNEWDQASAIDVDNSGNIHITGYYSDTLVFGETQLNETTLAKNGVLEIFIAKYYLDLNTISSKPYAGENNCIEICSNSNPINLFDSLLNNPDSGGIWSPALASGSGIFDPSIDAAGVYRYAVMESNCISDYAEITVSFIEQGLAGNDASINVCINNTPINLFEQIGGTPVSGGTWFPVLSSGTGVFNPTIDQPGVYTYTVTDEMGCSSDTSKVSVSIDVLPYAGEDGNLEICINSSSVDLFDSLTGTPNLGGVWTPSLVSGTGLFNPLIDAAGVYTYSVTNGECGSDTSKVNVTIDELPNAGEDGNLEICINSSSVDLFDSLKGTPDLGGVWTPSLVSGTGLFNPSIDATGVYTYTITNGICGSEAAEVNITVTKVTPISDYKINTKEFSNNNNNNNSIEVIINSSLQYEFSLDGIKYQSSNVFDNLSGGDYTVYVQEINGCGILEETVSILDYPKFFTPNNDGFNDSWKLKGKTDKNYSTYIYDRYGKLIKYLASPESSWDGFFNGNILPADDYWFKVIFTDGVIKRGHFTLKR
ncbi:T9SS type B sorting domain-containing protein [Mariniflexile sp. HNIBRBA6329]|uniref:T9SS type B sorting domain-containing protein n=1 Tax=Mariniflexile sp. HNIBRBA6329 TaxID=3373088 RepID=UPI003745E3FF